MRIARMIIIGLALVPGPMSVVGAVSGVSAANAQVTGHKDRQLRCTSAKDHKARRHQKLLEKCRRDAAKKKSAPKGTVGSGNITMPSTGSPTSPSPGPATDPSESCHTQAVTLHSTPEETLGPEELFGGIYDAGGPPAVPGSCDTGVYPAGAGTITVRDQGSHEVVAKETVVSGQAFAIPLKAGSYEAESTVCQIGGPVAFSVTQGYTTQYDFICAIS